MVTILDVTPPHEFDGIRAVGHWIVAEQVAVRELTQGGLVVKALVADEPWIRIANEVGKRGCVSLLSPIAPDHDSATCGLCQAARRA